MQKECIYCGAPANFKEGIKNGKAWKGYFCTDPQCKKAEWVRDTKVGPKPFSNQNHALSNVPEGISNELLFKIFEEIKGLRADLKSNNPFPT